MSDGKVPNLEDLCELSPAQAGMLFHTVHAPGTGVYVEQLTGTIAGRLDVPAFSQAWQQLVDRHPVFRTAFHWEGLEQPVQVVHRQVTLSIAQQSWQQLSEAAQAARLDELLAADRVRGFDLSTAPLMRVTLADLGNERFQFVWTHHHLLLDGWSIPIVLAEVIELYDAIREARPPRLDSRRPYRDYIRWLREQPRQRAIDAWREELRGFSAPVRIAEVLGDRATAAGQFRMCEARLSADTTLRVEGIARQSHLTLNTIVQGMWALLVSRYASADDVVFGAAVSGRPADLPGAAAMVGSFINAIPVRVQVRPEAATIAWLGALQERQARIRRYEHTPLLDIQATSEIRRGLALFDSMFVFANYPIGQEVASSDGSLRIAGMRAVESTNYPLTVFGIPGRELLLRVSYDAGRFSDEQMARLAGHLGQLLEGFAASPHGPVGQLALLPDWERRETVEEWNATAVRWPDEDACLDELIAAQAVRTPDAVAVLDEHEALSYAELDRRATAVAAAVQAAGSGPETVVGVCVDRSVGLLVALLGVMKAGAAYLPLDPTYPRARRDWMIADAGVQVVVSEARLLAAGEVTAPAVLDVAAASRRDGAQLAALDRDPQQAAYVIYTSGSTGRPKGAVNIHRAIVNRLRWMQAEYGLAGDERVLQKTPVSFDVSVWELFWPLLTGAAVVMARPEGHKDVGYLIDTVIRHTITTLHFVPSLLGAFVDDERVAGCASLRRIICSGEALGYELMARTRRRLPDAALYNLYGPTEAAVDVTHWRCDADGTGRVPIGRPIANTQMYVVDAAFEPAPIGVPGELLIGGVGVGRGYWRQPALTAARFVPDPFGPPGSRLYRTGDRAWYRADGALEFLGRQDFQVKVRGFRIEPGEVEEVLRAAGRLQDCVVTAQGERGADARLVAYVVPAPGAIVEVDALRAAARQQLPDYMVPTTFVVLEALPRLPNGKLDRASLPAPSTSRPDLQTPYVAPRTDSEHTVAKIWREAIGLERIGIDDNFFDVGGHSLLALRVFGHLREAVPAAADLALVDLFAYPTIRTLAERLSPAAPPVAQTAPNEERAAAGIDRLRQQRLRKQAVV